MKCFVVSFVVVVVEEAIHISHFEPGQLILMAFPKPLPPPPLAKVLSLLELPPVMPAFLAALAFFSFFLSSAALTFSSA
jgi:hypothetical protein